MAAGFVTAAETIDRTVPAVIAGSSQFNEREAPPALFDQYVETKWLATASTGWVTYKFLDGQAFAINSYALTSANDAPDRDPKNWTLEGSNDDGTTWTLVDTQTDVSWSGRFQKKTFNCTNTTAYAMYKFTVTANWGSGNLMQIAELEFIDNGISRTDYGDVTWSTQIGWNEGGLRAFDELIGTKWLTAGGNPTGWLQYEFLGDGAYAINGYSITSADDAPGRDPRDWTLQGSFDGANWDIIDTRVGEAWQISVEDEQRHVTRYFDFDNATAYKFYKLDVTANNGDSGLMGFAELELLERPLPGAAEYVSPANIEIEVPVDGTTLEWQAGIDPNSGSGTWDAIEGHYVYLGTSPDAMVLVTPTALPVETTTYAPSLETDLTYYWQVEEALSTDGLTTNAAGDPNNVMGRVWRFSTESSIVEVNPLLPVDTIVHLTESASFSVSATDPLEGTMVYQWYSDIDGVQTALTEGSKYEGVATDTLVINDVQEADKGLYFCSVTNDTNLIVYSNSANLYVKKLLAHWTLDAADYDGTYYADVTGLNDANVLSIPVFADGIANADTVPSAVPNGAIVTSEPNSTANVGPFNPSEETSQFSISAWIKYQATDENVTFNTIASKRDGWSASDQSYWQFLAVNNGQLRMQSYGLTSVNTAQGLITVDEWHHAVVTYADNLATLYVDGLEEGLGNFVLAEGADATFFIGRNDQLAERFDGTLDDVKAFNYALTPEEVVDLFTLETNEAVCLYGNPVGDLDENCKVDLGDLSVLAENWLEHGFYPFLP